VNDCIRQYFRCLSYCAGFSEGDLETLQECQLFCDATFIRCVSGVLTEVSQQIASLVDVRQAIEAELTSPDPSRNRLFELLNQLSAQTVTLVRLTRIREDLAPAAESTPSSTGEEGPEQTGSGSTPRRSGRRTNRRRRSARQRPGT